MDRYLYIYIYTTIDTTFRLPLIALQSQLLWAELPVAVATNTF